MSAALMIILVVLGTAAAAALILAGIALLGRTADQHKAQEALMLSGNVQSLPATVVAIRRNMAIQVFLLFFSMVLGSRNEPDISDSYYLMVEWTNPQTQARVTGRTKRVKGRCPYKVGESVSILVHPDILQVWVVERKGT